MGLSNRAESLVPHFILLEQRQAKDQPLLVEEEKGVELHRQECGRVEMQREFGDL